MKTWAYIVLIIIIGSIVYNFIKIDYNAWSSIENQPYLIGLCAGFCGLILALILIRYQQVKRHLNSRAK